MEALFKAYFTEGRDISDRQTLLDAVVEGGIEFVTVLQAELDSRDGLAAHPGRRAEAHRLGVQGAPFIVNGELALSGAQEPKAFLERLSASIRFLAGRRRGRHLHGWGRRRAVMLNGNGPALKVVVAGGSLGGLFNAIALRSLGCEVEVFEKSSEADAGP